MASPSPLSLTRRAFLRQTGAGAIATAGFPLLGPCAFGLDDSSSEDLQTISIFHTTDIHGHILPTRTYEGITGVGGLARCADQIRRWRRENPHHLVIDVGDLYQGTQVGRRSGGRLLMQLLNKLDYDAWIPGNHDFDWGSDVFAGVIDEAEVPVLVSNLELEGHRVGAFDDSTHPYSRIAPYLIREIAGFKIGVLGIITPGLPHWLRPEIIAGVVPLDPAREAATAVAAMKAAGVDCIIAAGHMGLKWGKDDFANPVRDVISTAKDIDVYLAGHTHQDMPSVRQDGTLYTQANYYGINAGRVDLTFSKSTRKLIDRRAFTVFMDSRFDLDPLVIDTSREELDAAKVELNRPIGVLTETLSAKTSTGSPGDVHLLFKAAIAAALARQGVSIDGLVHGLFSKEDVPAGEKRVSDMWTLIPYDNWLVTAELTHDELAAILEEIYNVRSSTMNLIGFDVRTRSDSKSPVAVKAITHRNGRALSATKRYRIAFNSYDSQSGGLRYPRLHEIVHRPASKSRFHKIETRDALIHYFLDQKEISRDSLTTAAHTAPAPRFRNVV